MQYRKLGRTGFDVGVIGLGAEHLEQSPYETVAAVVHEALDHGVNYIDLFMGSPGVRDNFGRALAGRSEEVLIAGHLGATWRDGQYAKSRDKAVCEAFIHDLLKRLRTDHLGVLMMHYVDEPAEYDEVFAPDGLLELALRLKEQGKARFLGMSGHMAPAAMRAAASGYLDVLMFPLNPLFDTLPGVIDFDSMWQEGPYQSVIKDRASTDREELYRACVRHGVGIVAMKPYAGGWAFNPENAGGVHLTPVQCLSYTLAQPAVCTVVPGCKIPEEMRAALAYLDAAEEQRDFSSLGTSPIWQAKGRCMYCNHCLPCPAGIDIAAVTRLLDSAGRGLTNAIRDGYGALQTRGSACTACGLCRERCPFGVDPAANMEKAMRLFKE